MRPRIAPNSYCRFVIATISAGVAVVCSVAQSTPATAYVPAPVGCSATDFAPESIAVRGRPTASSPVVFYVQTGSVTELIRLDAVTTARGNWLKVRGRAVGWVAESAVVCRLSSAAARQAITRQAAAVLAALKSADMAALVPFIHPAKGVRWSPQADVSVKTDVVLAASRLVAAQKSTTPRVWGTDDGSGRPLRMTFNQYFRKFVYSRDFIRAPGVTFNAGGEGAVKAWEAYPSAIVADHTFPATENATAVRLRLVFEQYFGQWYLVGIIHEGWTI